MQHHPLFVLSVLWLFILFVFFGIHKRVVAPSMCVGVRGRQGSLGVLLMVSCMLQNRVTVSARALRLSYDLRRRACFHLWIEVSLRHFTSFPEWQADSETAKLTDMSLDLLVLCQQRLLANHQRASVGARKQLLYELPCTKLSAVICGRIFAYVRLLCASSLPQTS